MDVHTIFWQKLRRNFGLPNRMVDYSIRKLAKLGVYLLWAHLISKMGHFDCGEQLAQ